MSKQRGYTLIEVLIAIAFLTVTALGCAGMAVAVHFIRKVW